jgi:hypothetical protein
MQRRTAGPFYKNGVDIYETNTALRVVSTIFLTVFVIGFVVYIGVAINSISFKHTYFDNPGDPGTLTSTRYTYLWFVVMLSVVSMGFLWVALIIMITFRDNYGSHMFWFILYFLLIGLLVFVLLVLVGQFISCNDPTQPNNICNSKLWCCVNYLNPANHCPNIYTGPCPGVTASDLKPKTEFLWIFWIVLITCVLHIVYFIIILTYWFSPGPPAVEEKDEVVEDESQIEYRMPSVQKNTTHSLRERKPVQNKIIF